MPAAPRKFWELLFPLPYRADLVRNAQERDLDPYLLAGLIRQESEFNPQAVSRAKAYGLTQIRPATGRQFARKAGVPKFTTRVLSQPAANLKIGSSILRSMLDQQGGKMEQTLAAYNAGPRARGGMDGVEHLPGARGVCGIHPVHRNARLRAGGAAKRRNVPPALPVDPLTSYARTPAPVIG